MNIELIESIESLLPTLEDVREKIIQIPATKDNRERLDRAYNATVDALTQLSRLARRADAESSAVGLDD